MSRLSQSKAFQAMLNECQKLLEPFGWKIGGNQDFSKLLIQLEFHLTWKEMQYRIDIPFAKYTLLAYSDVIDMLSKQLCNEVCAQFFGIRQKEPN